jgi:hypothetical protein
MTEKCSYFENVDEKILRLVYEPVAEKDGE